MVLSLGEACCSVLQTAEPTAKLMRARAVARDWRLGRIAHSFDAAMPDFPNRPAHPELLAPRFMPNRRRAGSERARIAMLHAFAHIEFVAIDLAFDLVGRFGAEFPREFADDWLRVAVPYRCVSGETVLAHYDDTTDTIRLRYRQTTVEMSPAVSASGARFTGGDWVWWTKGMDEGTLFTLLPDGDTGDLLDTCLAADAEAVMDGMENNPEDAAEVTGRATEMSTDTSTDLKNGTDAPAENR